MSMWVSAVRGNRQARKEIAERVLRRTSLSVEPRYHSLAVQRSTLLRRYQIDLVIDGGANIGQYAQTLRRSGYVGRIVSFEPQTEARRQLESISRADSQWTVEPFGLGSTDSTGLLRQTADSQSASLLEASATDDFGFTKQTGTEEIRIRTIDSFRFDSSNVLLKLDLQGYELEALAGAVETLASVRVVEVELSMRPMYAGSALIEDVTAHLRGAGFDPFTFVRGMTDATSHAVVQMDGLFVRRP